MTPPEGAEFTDLWKDEHKFLLIVTNVIVSHVLRTK